MKPRDEILSDNRLIAWQEITAGDVIECWHPFVIPTESWPPFSPDPGGLLHKSWTRVARQNDEDLAGRWTDDNGNLVHTEHSRDYEFLLRIGKAQ